MDKNKLGRLIIASFLTLFASLAGGRPATSGEIADPASVSRAYLRAVYARDFSVAYRYVSSVDQRHRSLDAYLRQRGPFSGFALQVGKLVAAMIAVDVTPTQVAPDRMLLRARYMAPDPEKIADLMRGWSGYRLNSLSAAERKQIIEAIETKKRDSSMEMLRGEENLTLVKEGNEWRVFLDWARGVTVPFRVIRDKPNGTAILTVTLLPEKVVIQPGELFEINLKIRNRSEKSIVLRVIHLVEPRELADYLEIVQCGFLLPVKLKPGIDHEYSATYLLRGSLPEGVHQLNLAYDLRLTPED